MHFSTEGLIGSMLGGCLGLSLFMLLGVFGLHGETIFAFVLGFFGALIGYSQGANSGY